MMISRPEADALASIWMWTAGHANLGRFSQILLDFESAIWRGGRRMKWETQLDRFAWYISTYAQTGYGEEWADDLPDIDAVTISTVHQAKGLEWPVVFVPALTSRRFPRSRTGRQQDWLLSRDLFDAARYEGNLESERRLFYVATTRARDVLVLSCFTKMATIARPSPFLAEVGELPLSRAHLDLAGKAASRANVEEEIMTLSIQEVLSYMRCPHEYWLRNVWGYEPEMVRELSFGRSVHHILGGIVRWCCSWNLVGSTIYAAYYLFTLLNALRSRTPAHSLSKVLLPEYGSDTLLLELSAARLVEQILVTGESDEQVRDDQGYLQG